MSTTTIVRVIAFSAVFLGLPLYWYMLPLELPIGLANGVYANTCCGSFELRDGVMRFGKNQRVRYVLEHDKAGRYVLPVSYVGIVDGRLIASDSAKSQTKLRLDDTAIPSAIELSDSSLSYVFQRKVARVR